MTPLKAEGNMIEVPRWLLILMSLVILVTTIEVGILAIDKSNLKENLAQATQSNAKMREWLDEDRKHQDEMIDRMAWLDKALKKCRGKVTPQ